MLAVIGGREDVVRVLCAAGADAALKDSLGLTVYDWAERRGFHELARLFEAAHRDASNSQPPAPVRSEPDRSASTKDKVTVRPHEEDKSQRWLAGVKKRWQEEELRDQQKSAAPEQMQNTPPVAPIIPSPIKPKSIEPKIVEVDTRSIAEEPVTAEPPPVTYSPTPVSKQQVESPATSFITPGTLQLSGSASAEEELASRKTWIWLLLLLVFCLSAAASFYVITYVSKKSDRVAVSELPEPIPQEVIPNLKSSIVLSSELVGKELSLPEPDYPTRAKNQGIGGTVVVRVRVNRRGRVVLARSVGGNWQLRAAAIEAATNAKFDPTKMPLRDVQGTISYTFTP